MVSYMNLFAGASRNMIATMGSFVFLVIAASFVCVGFIDSFDGTHSGMNEGYLEHSSRQVAVHECCDAAGITERMEFWKNMSLGVPMDSTSALISFIALAVVAATSFVVRVRAVDSIMLRIQRYARDYPDVHSYEPLRLAFARGILHSKTF